MKIYNYHPETGEYLGKEDADESPLEPGKFLVPAHATKKKPPIVDDHQMPVFSEGQWSVVPDLRGFDYWLPDGSKHRVMALGEALPDEALTEDPLPPAERHNEKIDAQRRIRYQADVDPFVIESLVKKAMGDDTGADAAMQIAIDNRTAIQAELVKE